MKAGKAGGKAWGKIEQGFVKVSLHKQILELSEFKRITP